MDHLVLCPYLLSSSDRATSLNCLDTNQHERISSLPSDLKHSSLFLSPDSSSCSLRIEWDETRDRFVIKQINGYHGEAVTSMRPGYGCNYPVSVYRFLLWCFRFEYPGPLGKWRSVVFGEENIFNSWVYKFSLHRYYNLDNYYTWLVWSVVRVGEIYLRHSHIWSHGRDCWDIGLFCGTIKHTGHPVPKRENVWTITSGIHAGTTCIVTITCSSTLRWHNMALVLNPKTNTDADFIVLSKKWRLKCIIKTFIYHDFIIKYACN